MPVVILISDFAFVFQTTNGKNGTSSSI